MEKSLYKYIDINHIDILEQLGNNLEYDNIYKEILNDYLFLVSIHIDSLSKENKEYDSNQTIIGYLPTGMIKNVAQSIDEKMIGASLPLKTCMWYEISRQLVQTSSFKYNFGS